MVWFESHQVTFKELKLSGCEGIFDLDLLVDARLRSIKRNFDNPTFVAGIDRMKRLKVK